MKYHYYYDDKCKMFKLGIKTCLIRNEKFTWAIYVDGVAINIDGNGVEYFGKHYSKLGYKVKIDTNYYKRG